MTMNVEHPIAQHVGNNGEKEFGYNYTVTDESWIQVFVDSEFAMSNTLYSINLDTKMITFITAPTDGANIEIRRSIPLDQLVDYTAYDAFPAETHEYALDKLTMILQDNLVLVDVLLSGPLNPTKVKQAYEVNLNTNAFTTGEKDKLATLEVPHFKGVYPSEAALLVANPTGKDGDYAFVNDGVSLDIMYVWVTQWEMLGHTALPVSAESMKLLYESNANTNAFTDADNMLLQAIKDPAHLKNAYESNPNTEVFTTQEKTKLLAIQEGATRHLEAPQVKTLYESNADTNEYSDADKAKLLGIDQHATDDQTSSEIKTAYELNANTNSFTDDEKNKLAGLQSSHFKGTYSSHALLVAAHPGPNEEGSYAYVHDGVNEQFWIWDHSGDIWELSAAAGGLNGATIKLMYEAEADTNAFSDSEKVDVAANKHALIGITHAEASGPVPPITHIDQPFWMNHPQIINPDYAVSSDSVELITVGNVVKMFHDATIEKAMTVAAHHHYTVADMRAFAIGEAKYVYSEPQESHPGSGLGANAILASTLEDFGIQHQGHPYVNAMVMRMSHNLWAIVTQEFTGSPHYPTVMFLLNLGVEFDDVAHGSTILGLTDAASFKSEVLELEHGIGDRDAFGAETMVEKIQQLEVAVNKNEQRIADVHGDSGHVQDEHTTLIVQDEHTTLIHVNNNGIHFCVAHDRPTDPEHLGINIYDGNEHKVKFVWDESPPDFSPAVPFDPAHVVDGTNTADWTTGVKPQMYFQKDADFRRFIDPVGNSILAFGTISAFITFKSIVTIKWVPDLSNPDNSKMEVRRLLKIRILDWNTKHSLLLIMYWKQVMKVICFKRL